MKIAPKPKPGQEMSLDKLLSDQVRPSTSTMITKTSEGWAVYPVETTSEPERLELSSFVGPLSNPKDIELRQTLFENGFRLITADEFYGVLKTIRQAQASSNNPLYAAAEELRLKVLTYFEGTEFESKEVITGTTIEYSPAGVGRVIHFRGLTPETSIDIDLPNLKWGKDENGQKVLGAADFSEYFSVWQHTFGGRPLNFGEYLPDFPPESNDTANLIIYVSPSGFRNDFYSQDRLGRPLYVRTIQEGVAP